MKRSGKGYNLLDAICNEGKARIMMNKTLKQPLIENFFCNSCYGMSFIAKGDIISGDVISGDIISEQTSRVSIVPIQRGKKLSLQNKGFLASLSEGELKERLDELQMRMFGTGLTENQRKLYQ